MILVDRGWVAAASALIVIAGCLETERPVEPSLELADPFPLAPIPSDRVPKPDIDFSTHWDWDHGGDPTGQNQYPPSHAIPDLHHRSHGMDLVAYHPLTRSDQPGPKIPNDASFAAVDTWSANGHYYACVTHNSPEPGGGATLLDISDPSAPRVITTLLSGSQDQDCQFTDDGRFLLLSAQTTGASVVPGVPGAPPPAVNLFSPGVLIYDLTDKANPRFLRHDTTGPSVVESSSGNAFHLVATATIHGKNYVFQPYSGHILELDATTGALTIVATLPVSRHDYWIGQHPVTGTWIAATGAGESTAFYDVEDPSNPRELATWEPSDPQYTGWHRQWAVDGLVDGRALMFVAGEFGDPPWYTVLDFTDPTDILELGHWIVPTPDPNSQHEFEIWNGYVATANYHSGVWIVDIGTTERAHDPVTLAYYLPNEDPADYGGIAAPLGARGLNSPSTWSAAFDDRGYVYTADATTGFYVLKFHATLVDDDGTR